MLLAYGIVNPAVPQFDNPENAPGMFGTMIAGVVGILLVGATLWAFFQLLIGGFNWISSSGDKGKLEAAQQRILQAIIGLTIVVAAWTIFLVILRFFGMSSGSGGSIELIFPTLFGKE